MPANSDSYIRSRLADAIFAQMQNLSKKEAREGFAQLSKAYRSHNAQQITGPDKSGVFLSYIAGRMLSTFAVVETLFQEWLQLGIEAPKSLLDIGAGPGTVAFAASEVFELESIALFEKEPTFRDLALKLAQAASVDEISNAKWHMGDVANQIEFPSSDLVTASYSLGELNAQDALKVSERAYEAAQIAFILIEPGTPKGFELTRTVRDRLLSLGAYVAAPCPHQKACPMQGTDFCHFSRRLVREDFHRSIKGASLPFEDEKYAYAIFTKKPVEPYAGRIVKKPIYGSGHVTLDICTDGRIERRVVSRSKKDFYKMARKTTWGDRVTSLPTRDQSPA